MNRNDNRGPKGPRTRWGQAVLQAYDREDDLAKWSKESDRESFGHQVQGDFVKRMNGRKSVVMGV